MVTDTDHCPSSRPTASLNRHLALREAMAMTTLTREELLTRLQKALAPLIKALRPEFVLLFGSYAYGEPHPHSDLDLLVVLPEAPNPDGFSARLELVQKHLAPQRDLPSLEWHILTMDEFQREMRKGNVFLAEVLEKGLPLAQREGMGGGFAGGEGVDGARRVPLPTGLVGVGADGLATDRIAACPPRPLRRCLSSSAGDRERAEGVFAGAGVAIGADARLALLAWRGRWRIFLPFPPIRNFADGRTNSSALAILASFLLPRRRKNSTNG
jgi:predicted nucleotidyltransferase